ncbi:MAG TPA: cell envelope integrity protein TolA [Woeseiaceae bacterium]|nr:cell envelope integrity protein TolA [Woeseiaceae bacterium]
MTRRTNSFFSITLALLLHVVIFATFAVAVNFSKKTQPAVPLAITATLTSEIPEFVAPPVEVQPEPEVIEPEPELVEPEPEVVEPEPEVKQPDPAEQARIKAEEQMRLDEMRREQQREQDAERARLQRIEDEKEEQQKRAAEAEAKRKAAEAEAKRKKEAEAELERKRIEAERAREERERQQREENERLRREAEQAQLQSQIDAENKRLEARSSNEMLAYIFAIQQKVRRNWVAPPSAPPDLECEVVVRQQATGDVTSAKVTRCNGDAAVVRSIETAVMKASPLPRPSNNLLFDTNLRFIFKPEQ